MKYKMCYVYRRKVMPVVLHGDAAFSGQGIVPEVMEVDIRSWFLLCVFVHVCVFVCVYLLMSDNTSSSDNHHHNYHYYCFLNRLKYNCYSIITATIGFVAVIFIHAFIFIIIMITTLSTSSLLSYPICQITRWEGVYI